MAELEEYVAARGPALLRTAYMLCGDRYLAEDLVQEVLARIHGRWQRQHIEHLDAYLKAAVVRQFLSWRRRRAGNEPLVEPGREPAGWPGYADTTADAHAERDAIWAELAGLPRQQRAVLVLRYYEDLPDERIAELLGCAPVTVRVHASRALASLRSRRGLDAPATQTTAQTRAERTRR
jgi:RNA polymerase sigma-70 factor (sigma-E family)